MNKKNAASVVALILFRVCETRFVSIVLVFGKKRPRDCDYLIDKERVVRTIMPGVESTKLNAAELDSGPFCIGHIAASSHAKTANRCAFASRTVSLTAGGMLTVSQFSSEALRLAQSAHNTAGCLHKLLRSARNALCPRWIQQPLVSMRSISHLSFVRRLTPTPFV